MSFIKKYVGWIVALVVVAGIAFGVFRWQKAHATPDIVWKTAPVEKRKISARVTASGTLAATVTVQVGAQVSGRVAKLTADYNSIVKKGELIAKIDPQLFQAAVEQADANAVQNKASLVSARAKQKDAELVLARTQALAEQSLASAADLQTAETNVAVAKASTDLAVANLAQADAALHQARVNLSYTDIFSPIDGTVISRSVDVGQTVASSLQAPILYTIAEDLRKMQVHTNVAEGDVGRLAENMDATFTVDAYPGQTFKGIVGQIRNAAQTVQNVVTYDAVIDVDNSDQRLRPGMTATVTIVYAEREDAVAVPNAALRFRPPPEVASAVGVAEPPAGAAGSATAGASAPRRQRPPGSGGGSGGGKQEGNERRTVYVQRGSIAQPVSVAAGLSDGTVSEVVRGDVKPGDEVVIDVNVGGKTSSGQGGGGPSGGGQPRMGRMF
ncbi:MAG: efflux RND transporter periplasmic adaptor subunit [Polyangiaceae bacterium]|nr:efflux RND transporter periplasmic adaptor subunit [Polyangiaceae bacterium]